MAYSKIRGQVKCTELYILSILKQGSIGNSKIVLETLLYVNFIIFINIGIIFRS